MTIDSSLKVYNEFEFIKDYEHEELWLLCLNSNEITGKIMLSKGGKCSTIFDGALFAKEILNHKYTRAVCLIHNHPTGNTSPSKKDDEITEKAKKICNLFDFDFLDHVIIARNSYYSYADSGKL